MAKRVSLFKVLRRELGPALAAGGFGEVPQDASSRNHILLYSRKSLPPETSVEVWFQRDVKSLYVDALGSAFTLEFFRGLEDDFPGSLADRMRLYFLLTALELEEMRGLQNQVIKRLPPLESVFAPWEVKIHGEFADRYRQLFTEPFNPLHEVWMRYRDEEDILLWTTFVGRIFPALVERFEVAKP